MSINNSYCSIFVKQLHQVTHQSDSDHLYVTITRNKTSLSIQKKNRSSLSALISEIEKIQKAKHISQIEAINLKCSCKSLKNRISKAKPHSWLYTLPIISTIYTWRKNTLLQRLEKISCELSPHSVVLNKDSAIKELENSPYGSYCVWVDESEKLLFLQKRPLQTALEDEIEQLQSAYEINDLAQAFSFYEKKGLFNKELTQSGEQTLLLHDHTLLFATKLPGDKKSAIYTVSEKNIHGHVAQFLDLVKNTKGELALLQQGNCYYPSSTDSFRQHCHHRYYDSIKDRDYQVIHFQDANTLGVVQKIKIGDFTHIRKRTLDINLPIFDQIDAFLAKSEKFIHEKTNGKSYYDMFFSSESKCEISFKYTNDQDPFSSFFGNSFNKEIPIFSQPIQQKTVKEKIVEAKNAVISFIDPKKDPNNISFDELLKMRKEYLKRQHTDKGGKQTTAFNGLWDTFSKTVQTHFKDGPIDVSMMQELDNFFT